MTTKSKIRVVLADTFVRESVLLDTQGNEIAEGETTQQLIRTRYNRRNYGKRK